MWNQEEEIREEKSAQGALLGLFTSYGNSYYIEDTTSGKKRRKTMSIRKDDLLSLLKKSVLKNFEISLYGSNENGEPDTDFESSQLGLF